MRQCIPDWRWQAIVKAARTSKRPDDEYLGHVYDVWMGATQDEVLEYVFEIYQIPLKRDTVTSFLLCRATMLQITRGTKIPEEVIQAYERIYLDPDHFRDKIDLRLYTQFYLENICNPAHRTQLQKAIVEGPYSLMAYWQMGNESYYISDEELASQIVMVAMAKMQVAAHSSILENASKEALKWCKTAIQGVSAKNKLNPAPTDTADLMFELQTAQVTTPIGIGSAGFDLEHLEH